MVMKTMMLVMAGTAGCCRSLGRRALLDQRPSWTQRPVGAASYKWGSRAGTIASSISNDKKPTYIVIGAGSAGCVLANRLTENPSNQVLLLEAGPRDHRWNWKFHMPAALMYNLCDNKYNWFYHTTAQRNMGNRAIYWPRGRVWGGSSTLNAMVYVRGHPMDYDRWESEGASGWSFSHVLPYFKKAQTHELSQGSSDLYRGWNGPLHVMQGKCENVLHQAFIESGVQHGIGRVDDMNGYKQEGTGPMDLTIHNGLRWSASRAYIWPILDRPNLHTSSGILCTKILFNKNKAIGVEFIRKDGPMYDRVDSWNREKIYCEKGVILSGGAINSPQLLMLSGIGPEKNLKAYDIPVIQHMPGIGRNLQDHLEIYIQQKCTQPITLYDKSSFRFPHNMIKIGLEWYLRKTGLGASSHLESGGFVRSSPEISHPDIQFHFLPSTVHNDGRSVGACHAYQVHVGPMRSKSKGVIVLSSKDPRMHPIINPNYLNHEDDFIEFRRAIKISRALLGQQCFDEFRDDELQPGKDCQTDKELNEFVKKEAASAYHPSCTCKMGSGTDKFAVVDPKTMGVHGIENLYVADASVMPSIVSGNLNGPAIMVAERAADLIMGKETLKEEFVPIWSSEKCVTKEQVN